MAAFTELLEAVWLFSSAKFATAVAVPELAVVVEGVEDGVPAAFNTALKPVLSEALLAVAAAPTVLPFTLIGEALAADPEFVTP